jgi:hypothetical protein
MNYFLHNSPEHSYVKFGTVEHSWKKDEIFVRTNEFCILTIRPDTQTLSVQRYSALLRSFLKAGYTQEIYHFRNYNSKL